MSQQENLVVCFAEMLAKQNATPEEKKIQALIKTAMYDDNLITFIDEVSKAFNGCGKVKVDTVKGVTEYNQYCSCSRKNVAGKLNMVLRKCVVTVGIGRGITLKDILINDMS